MLDLYIGNKNCSSWSLRAWLLMKHFGIPFREHLVSVAGRDYNPALKALAGNARVPCLHDGGFQVWGSIAIAEFLAERHPELWLAGARARALHQRRNARRLRRPAHGNADEPQAQAQAQGRAGRSWGVSGLGVGVCFRPVDYAYFRRRPNADGRLQVLSMTGN
jgi:glutathione S-transferase